MITLALLLASCADPVATTAPMKPPPPYVVSLAVPPLITTLPAVFHVQAFGAGPGLRVHLAWGENIAGAHACLPALGGACLAMHEPHLAASGVTDAAGHAELTWVLPLLYDRQVRLQAAVVIPGQPAALSDARLHSYQRVDADDDHDGLLAGDEVTVGLDAFRRDTDGGGIGDGQEYRIDLTDPLDGSDDRPGERSCGGGEDDDGDEMWDCDDPDCAMAGGCGESVCDDGVDDDLDGRTDCADANCRYDAPCIEAACGNGSDDDGDGLADCADDDCWTPACHDEVISWVVAGAVTGQAMGGTITELNPYYTEGRVWVNGSGGPRLCTWTLGSSSTRANGASACRINQGLVPPMSALTLDPSAGLTFSDGSVWAGPLTLLVPLTGGEHRWKVDPVGGSAPWGTCAGGGPPTLMWQDQDGDGFGVDGRTDLFGRPGGRVWACSATPGLTTSPGDCHDGDPAWNPAAVILAPGATCATLSWRDQDGDGVLRDQDSDDRNGLVP